MMLHVLLPAAVLVLLSIPQSACAQADTRPAQLFTDCPGVAPDYMPECWIAAHARLQVGGDRVFYCECVLWVCLRAAKCSSSAVADTCAHALLLCCSADRDAAHVQKMGQCLVALLAGPSTGAAGRTCESCC